MTGAPEYDTTNSNSGTQNNNNANGNQNTQNQNSTDNQSNANSANGFNSGRYAVGVARAPALLGPYEKWTAGPV